VLGDVNVSPSCSLTKLFLSILRQVQLTDIIGEPTRITINTSSQIDAILTTDPQCFDSTRGSIDGSDHHLIVTHFYPRGICLDPPARKIISIRNFKKLDTEKLDELFMCDDIWDDVMSSFDNISDCVECFNEIVLGLLDMLCLVPLKKLRVRHQNCPWLSSASLTEARHLHDIAHRRALKSKSHSDCSWSLYRFHRNKVNSMLRSAKYFENLSSVFGSNPARFWRRFQSFSRCSRPLNNAQLSVSAEEFN